MLLHTVNWPTALRYGKIHQLLIWKNICYSKKNGESDLKKKHHLHTTPFIKLPSQLNTTTLSTSTKGQRQPFYQASAAWNQLPAEIRLTKNTQAFKAVLKQHLLSTLVQLASCTDFLHLF